MWKAFFDMPKPLAQITLLVLLGILLSVSVWTAFLLVWDPEGGRLVSASRWAGTAAGIAVCAAFFQFQTTKWLEDLGREFGDAEKYPYGPPSTITRFIFSTADWPRMDAIKSFLFYETGLTAFLGLWAGVFTIVSYWVD